MVHLILSMITHLNLIKLNIIIRIAQCYDFKIQSFICTVGQGQSEGFHNHVDSFNEYTSVIFQHCNEVKEKYSNLPLFVFGNSVVNTLMLFLYQIHVHCNYSFILQQRKKKKLKTKQTRTTKP